jgi:hypothetical protein
MKFLLKSLLLFAILSFTLVGCQSEDKPKEPVKPATTQMPAKPGKKAPAKAKTVKLPPMDKLIKLKQTTHYSVNRVGEQVVKDAKQPIAITGNMLSIRGWAFDKAAKEAAGGVYIKIGDKSFPATATPSPGIAKNFKNPALSKSGFSLNVPVNQIGKGQFDISVFVLTSNQKAAYAPLPVKNIKIKI